MIKATARVWLTVEIDVSQPWGDDCSVGQIYKQAVDSAQRDLMNALKDGKHGTIRVIGQTKIISVITENSEYE